MNANQVIENGFVTCTDPSIKPMRLLESMLMFGIPAVLLAASLYGLWPLLTAWGISDSMAYAIAISSLNILLGLGAVAGYRLENRPWTWSDFLKRMRLTGLRGRIWWWVASGVLAFGLISLFFVILLPIIYKALNFIPPEMTGVRMNLFTTVVVLFLISWVKNCGGATISCHARNCPLEGPPGGCMGSCGPVSTCTSGGESRR